MPLYNHSLAERRWLELRAEKSSTEGNLPTACTVLVPGKTEAVGLENARLLVLTDFFASAIWGRDFTHRVIGNTENLPKKVLRLGIEASPATNATDCQLAVLPRDFPQVWRGIAFSSAVACGRLLGGPPLELILPDFGGDALRLFFLFQGPPERDYSFNWHGLFSAYRFVQRVWRLSQSQEQQPAPSDAAGALRALTAVVRARIDKRKPHTALAAIMAYLKDKTALSPVELRAVAELLRPFAPVLSAELSGLVTSVQDDDHRQADEADG